ncbi:MAG: DNA alkylation repair protein [Candidatus Cyclobacteriaceae bacterium M3_2C_046]
MAKQHHDPIIDQVRMALENQADQHIRQRNQRFFKEPIRSYGIKNATVTQISKEFYKSVKRYPKNQILDLCEYFWQSGLLEESMVACHWTYKQHKDFESGDFKLFESWISNYVNNWASCDTFCNRTVGEFIERYPEYLSSLKGWTCSDNRWVKRASAVSLIVPARKGRFLPEIMAIAQELMMDQDDLVQKGYGWLLKVASQRHQQEIFNFIMKHKYRMPRTALRYAIEKMPTELRKGAMKK